MDCADASDERVFFRDVTIEELGRYRPQREGMKSEGRVGHCQKPITLDVDFVGLMKANGNQLDVRINGLTTTCGSHIVETRGAIDVPAMTRADNVWRETATVVIEAFRLAGDSASSIEGACPREVKTDLISPNNSGRYCMARTGSAGGMEHTAGLTPCNGLRAGSGLGFGPVVGRQLDTLTGEH